MAHIVADNLSLVYPVLSPRSQSLRANLVRFGSAGQLARDSKGMLSIKALDDISFVAEQGDRIALIGRNGSGKSTLLRILGGIHSPTTGKLTIEGEVSSVLGVNLNVDEELTGYESIRYACLMRGIPEARIAEITENVEEFTGLGDYLNIPVRTYSSGMKIRLAFAVATSEAPDILVLDEGITAGDAFFVERSTQRANNFLDAANILFLASHSEHLIRSVCNKGLLLDSGRIIAAGGLDEVFEIYQDIERPPNPVPSVALPYFSPQTTGAPTEAPIEVYGSEHAEHHPIQAAFDGSVVTYWKTTPGFRCKNQAHVGVCLPEPFAPKTALLRQHASDFDGSSCVPTVAIETSNDGFADDIRRVTVVRLSPRPILHRIPLSAGDSGQWWRVIALDEPNDPDTGWAISRFDLLPDSVAEWHVGRAISNGSAESGVDTPNAFDSEADAPWVSYERGDDVAGNSWIGWDFGNEAWPTIRYFEIAQWDGGGNPNTVTEVLLQCSDDAFETDVSTVGRYFLDDSEDMQRVACVAPRRARCWRLIAASGTGGGRWGVSYVRFLE